MKNKFILLLRIYPVLELIVLLVINFLFKSSIPINPVLITLFICIPSFLIYQIYEECFVIFLCEYNMKLYNELKSFPVLLFSGKKGISRHKLKHKIDLTELDDNEIEYANTYILLIKIFWQSSFIGFLYFILSFLLFF